MFMNTQILSHYSANKSSDVGALCGRAGHLIKTALKKKEQIVISSWGSLRVSCKAHMVIWKSMCHFGDSSGSLGGQLAGLAGMDQVTPGVEVQCEGSRVTLPSLILSTGQLLCEWHTAHSLGENNGTADLKSLDHHPQMFQTQAVLSIPMQHLCASLALPCMWH